MRAFHPFCAKRGLTSVQLRILIALYFTPGQALRELSENTCMAVTNCSAQSKRLASMGLLVRQRDPTDERQVRLSLSPEGDALVEELRTCCASSLQTLAGGLSEEDANHFLAGLEKLATLFEEENAP